MDEKLEGHTSMPNFKTAIQTEKMTMLVFLAFSNQSISCTKDVQLASSRKLLFDKVQ